MTKKYSSYKEHQLITENWREFTSEGETALTEEVTAADVAGEEGITAADLAHLAKRPAHGKTEADMIEDVIRTFGETRDAYSELQKELREEEFAATNDAHSPRMVQIRTVSTGLVNLAVQLKRLMEELQGLTPLPYTPKSRD
tara:strand:- start:22 stop:447 length:426 start_codon:yes stop_codon:yes gene_type:complete